MHRMMGKKSPSSYSGSGVESVYDDDFFHDTESTSVKSTSVTEYSSASDTTKSSTPSTAMKTLTMSVTMVGAGFLMFALFLAIATIIRKVNKA